MKCVLGVVVASIVSCGAPAPATPPSPPQQPIGADALPASAIEQPLVGRGRGIDHATMLISSQATASQDYAALGFTVVPHEKLPYGFESAYVFFANGTYLELFAIWDRDLVAKSTEAFTLTAPLGLTWNILHVDSTERVLAALRERGFDAKGPEIVPTPEAWSYKLVELVRDGPGGRLFFIVYNEDRRATNRAKDPEKYARRESHPNTAQGMHAVWIAARDLQATATALEKLGILAGPERDVPALRARGREITFANGSSLLLLQGRDATSPVSTFLGTRDGAYMGASIRVASLARASEIVKRGGAVAEYDGLYGRSILIPGSRAQNTWFELFERSRD